MRTLLPAYALLAGLLGCGWWRCDSFSRYVFAPWLHVAHRGRAADVFRCGFVPLTAYGASLTAMIAFHDRVSGAAVVQPVSFVGLLLVGLLAYAATLPLMGLFARLLFVPLMADASGREWVAALCSPWLRQLPATHPVRRLLFVEPRHQ